MKYVTPTDRRGPCGMDGGESLGGTMNEKNVRLSLMNDLTTFHQICKAVTIK